MTLDLGERPPLADLDLEEYDEGVYVDSASNRARLVRAQYRWETEYDTLEDGRDVTTLRVLSDEDLARQARAKQERYAAVLQDRERQHSDYVVPLPAELTHDAPVPSWVRSSGRKWQAAIDRGEDPHTKPSFWLPARCEFVKRDGTRCWSWAGSSRPSHELGLCRTHLNANHIRRDTTLATARDRVWQSAPDAVDALVALALTGEAEPVRLRAATELLDRAGIRGGTELDVKAEVTHTDAAAEVRERLQALLPKPLPILDTTEAEESA